MVSAALLSLAALCLSGHSRAVNVDWANAGTFWGQPLTGNGPYGFGACSPTQLTVLGDLFVKGGRILEQIIGPELVKGDQSAAFNTFFSPNGSQIPQWSQNGLSVPQEVFTDIDQGPWNRSVDGIGIANGGPVIFACNNDGYSSANPSTQEATIKCGPGLAAAYFKTDEQDVSKAHWLLCNPFFNDTAYPEFPTQDMCPTWSNSYGYSASPVHQVKDTKFGLMIQMLAQIYSQNAGARRTDQQDINDVIYEDFSTQAAHATNYQWFGTMMAANCTSWPDWADPNYNATAAAEAAAAGYDDPDYNGTAAADLGDGGAKRRSVDGRVPASSDGQARILQGRADDPSRPVPPHLKHDPQMSSGGSLGVINSTDIPAALITDLNNLANIKPAESKLGSVGKLGMSGKVASGPLAAAFAAQEKGQ